jgi:transcriptional regulator with XRE-family HTH domain
MSPAILLCTARRDAGLTQAELARRLGTTQSAIARMERPGANPTVAWLDRALAAAGRRLELGAERPPTAPEVDATQIAERLALTPAERVATFQRSQRNLNALRRRARRVDDDA